MDSTRALPTSDRKPVRHRRPFDINAPTPNTDRLLLLPVRRQYKAVLSSNALQYIPGVVLIILPTIPLHDRHNRVKRTSLLRATVFPPHWHRRQLYAAPAVS